MKEIEKIYKIVEEWFYDHQLACYEEYLADLKLSLGGDLIRNDFNTFLERLKVDFINKDLVDNSGYGVINLGIIYKDLLKENKCFVEYSYDFDIPTVTKNEDETIISTKDKIVFRPVLCSGDIIVPKQRRFDSYEELTDSLEEECKIINEDNVEDDVVIFVLESYPQLYNKKVIVRYAWVKISTLVDVKRKLKK